MALLLALALVVAGCGEARPGAAIAEKIRAANSPIVKEVIFSPYNPFGNPEFIVVLLTDEATEAQALDLWCTVIVPAGAAQMTRPGVELIQGLIVDPAGGRTGGHRVLGDHPACPGDGSPTPTT